MLKVRNNTKCFECGKKYKYTTHYNKHLYSKHKEVMDKIENEPFYIIGAIHRKEIAEALEKEAEELLKIW